VTPWRHVVRLQVRQGVTDKPRTQSGPDGRRGVELRVSAITCYRISGARLTDAFGTFKTISGAFTPDQGAPFTATTSRAS
jgi:hypothetical protein